MRAWSGAALPWVCNAPPSSHFAGRHHELGALADARGPALHHALLLGVEAHALFAVGVHVAEQALLPAAEAVPGHRHRDRHVDADHAHLHPAGELARHVAVAGEAGHAVAELVVVDQLQRAGEILRTRTQASTGPKISSL
jgi:hypothetical protein